MTSVNGPGEALSVLYFQVFQHNGALMGSGDGVIKFQLGQAWQQVTCSADDPVAWATTAKHSTEAGFDHPLVTTQTGHV